MLSLWPVCVVSTSPQAVAGQMALLLDHAIISFACDAHVARDSFLDYTCFLLLFFQCRQNVSRKEMKNNKDEGKVR